MILPEDMLIHIIKYLDLKELLSLRLTSKYFKKLSSHGRPVLSTSNLPTFPRTNNPINISFCLSHILEFLRIFPRTKVLKISFLSVNDNLINQILSPYLEELDFSFNTKLTDKGLDLISKKCKKLRVLKITCCNSVTVEGLKKKLVKFKKLKKLHLWSSYSISKEDSDELSKMFENVSIIYYPMFGYIEN